MGFFDESRAVAAECFLALGEPASVTRQDGQTIATRAAIGYQPVVGRMSTQIGTILELPRVEVPELGHGDRITLQGEVWRVEAQVDSDDDVLRVRVRRDAN